MCARGALFYIVPPASDDVTNAQERGGFVYLHGIRASTHEPITPEGYLPAANNSPRENDLQLVLFHSVFNPPHDLVHSRKQLMVSYKLVKITLFMLTRK